jgi:hypothetical protein
VRAPNKSRLDEVVQEIIDLIIQSDADADDRFSTEFSVRSTIGLLQQLDREIAWRGAIKQRGPFRGYRPENIEDVTALHKQIKELQKALKRTSSPALFLLFSDENDLSCEIPSTEAQRVVVRQLPEFTAMLDRVRNRCEFLLAEQPGERPNAGYRQRRAAREAWRLLNGYWRERAPAGGTYGSRYGAVASLLWEAMTGERNKDLERACKAALRLADEGDLREDGPVIGAGQILEFEPSGDSIGEDKWIDADGDDP